MLVAKEVLIVESDVIFRQIIVNLLQEEGCVVQVAQNAQEGIKALREKIPDLLISDLSMAGIEFVENISKQYCMLPIIVISDINDMKEVAQALRYGVKDFLIKPIYSIDVVKSAIAAVLKDSEDVIDSHNDFSQQWFNLSKSNEKKATEELQWHLDELLDNPNSARDLLIGLMPDPDSRQGLWRLSYHSLQSIDTNPIVLDYTWVIDGKMFFYMVDSASGGKNGTVTTLMIRAFFNQFIRSFNCNEKSFIHLINQIEYAIKKSSYTSPIKATFGMLDVVNHRLHILSAGLNVLIDEVGNRVIVKNNHLIGIDAISQQFNSIDLYNDRVNISLNEIGLTSFRLDIQKMNI